MSRLNIEQADQLQAYLRASGHVSRGERVRCRVLRGGVSNRTVWVGLGDGRQWVLKQALPKLRVAVDWFSSPRRIEREAAGIRVLSEILPHGSVPGFVFEDRDQDLLAMEAVPEPHQNWKLILLSGKIEAGAVEAFAGMLAAIHRESRERAERLLPLFEDRSFFESLRLEPYYLYTASQAPPAAGFYRDLVRETRATRQSIVHGDYSPKNILIHQDRLVLLDHEVIHWGDPAFDLGFSLTHFLSKAHHLPPARSAFSSAALRYWEIYREESGGDRVFPGLESRAVAHTLGCLLGRVRGRSTLEYLGEPERERQERACLRLMESRPGGIPQLVSDFIARIEQLENNP